MAPQWILTDERGAWIAIEAAIVVSLFALVPRRRWSRLLSAVVAFAIVLVSVVVLADTVARQSLARPLNLYLDINLLDAVLNLIRGMIGSLVAALVVPGLLVGAVLCTWLLSKLLAPAEIFRGTWVVRATGIALMVLSISALLRLPGRLLTEQLAYPAARVAADQTRHFFRMMNERQRFEAQLSVAPAGYGVIPGLFERLEDRDVIVGFIESYGLSAITDPRYAPVIVPRLEEFADRMTDAKLRVVSGALVAPSQGGQSWFGRASLLSGLWLDNQLRYDLLLASGRETLIDDFRHAGYRTVALMPGITRPWLEGERLGYDQIYTRKEIDYAGPALNWVTMPDQFAWSFLEQRIRADDDPRPLFVELGLISSHAPWTPILPVLEDWSSIGDGAIFEKLADGERPVDLWRDHDRVREHYALSVDYAIHTTIAYAERHVGERTLLIALGDHQPAPMITGEGASRAAPVHVISADPELLQPFLEWGFVNGGLPDLGRQALRMDLFRDWFVRAFSKP